MPSLSWWFWGDQCIPGKTKKVSPSMKILWGGRHVWRYWRRSFRGRASISSTSFHLSHLPHSSRLFSISKNIRFRFFYRFRHAYRNISNSKLCWVEIWKRCKNESLFRFCYWFSIDFDTHIKTSLIQIYVVKNVTKMEVKFVLFLLSVSINFSTPIETYLIQSYVDLKIWQKWVLNLFSLSVFFRFWYMYRNITNPNFLRRVENLTKMGVEFVFGFFFFKSGS